MRIWIWSAFFVASLAVVVTTAFSQRPTFVNRKAPELRDVDSWINTKPLKLADLRGQVVVVHFFTTG
jgi:hypothetical protein